MLKTFFNVVFVIIIFSFSANAITLTDSFDSGINNNLWDIERYDAINSPWTIIAPDESYRLRISKSADDGTTTTVAASIQSRFIIGGDFSIWVEYDMIDFPLANNGGWNYVGLVVRIIDDDGHYNGTYFGSALNIDDSNQISFGYANIPPSEYFGGSIDTTMHGKLGISREDDTMSAWIDRGYGPVLLGSLTYPELNGAVKVLFSVNQQPNILNERPSTSLDVRFDKFSVTAETIIPEPTTFLLLSICVFFLRKGK
ncbi:MAG: hypothetical protein C4541_07590 [Candidatus Auribacter fodinae]|jgi:hypothetical protein|uniref:PEP-CTERM sorting domain-containing protein n=1 Tax=Candidatus Auribacter fodinae TaxID=2093366 RepID=A0A3A4R2J3_9BACT|nr:MAG: hypothetical protein C4541_07590 [Candidatus Auribacter fodinae]